VNVKNVCVIRVIAENKGLKAGLNAVNGRKRDNTAYTEVTS
jgi:hypothetical protein